jgi:Armadillo/beta-catenin-like repeat
VLQHRSLAFLWRHRPTLTRGRHRVRRTMIDNLQTLCAAALRRQLVSANEDDDNDEGSTPLDIRGVVALAECLRHVDNPFLQIEAAWALNCVFDRLTREERRKVFDYANPFTKLLFLRCVCHDEVRTRAGVALEAIVNRTNETGRSWVWWNLVRGAKMDDPAVRVWGTNCFVVLLSLDNDPPVQRAIDFGVVAHLVESLRRDDPELQCEAAQALTCIAQGSSDQAKVAIDEGVIPIFVRLLQTPDDDVKARASEWLDVVARKDPIFRDLILRNGAIPALVLQLGQSLAPDTTRRFALTVSGLCRGNPLPDFALVRPALGTLARLIFSSDEVVLGLVCWTLHELADGSGERIEAIVEVGVCRRLVELMGHPDPDVQRYVRWTGVGACKVKQGSAPHLCCNLARQLCPPRRRDDPRGRRPAETGDPRP